MRHALVLLALCAPLSAHAIELAAPIRAPGHWGVGIGGGLGPSGISAKYFFSERTSLQGVVGVYGHGRPDWYDDDETIGVDIDFLFEMPAITTNEVFELGWEIGLGGWAGFGDRSWLGANGVLGLQFNFVPAPIDLVLEYKPGFLLVPSADVDVVNFGGHLRIYFM